MRPVVRQVRANLRSHRLQHGLIAVTLLVASALLSIAALGRNSATDAWDRLHERTGSPHLWVYLDPQYVEPSQALDTLAALPGVVRTSPVMRGISARALGFEGLASDLEIREWPGAGALGAPLVVEGRAPERGETDALVLDRNLAALQGIDVGGVVPVPVNSTTRVEFRVVGLSVGAELCPHPVCNPPTVFASPGALRSLELDPPPAPNAVRDIVALRLQNADDTEQAERAVIRALPRGAVRHVIPWQETRRDTRLVAGFQISLLGAFGVISALVAGILIANAVAGAVRAQTRNLALLKAVGFTGRQLVAVVLAEYLGLSLLAGAVGAGAGAVMARPILTPVTEQFGIDRPEISLVASAVPVVLIVVLAALFAAVPVRRVIRLDTVSAIRVGAERPRRRRRRGRPLARLPIAVAHGVAEVLSRPGRAVLTGLGLTVAVVAMVWVIAINSMLSSVVTDPEVSFYGDGDLRVMRSGLLEDDEARRILDARSEIEAYMVEYYDFFAIPGESEQIFIRALDGDVSGFRAPLLEGRMAERPDEAVAGYGLARERGLDPGDTMTVTIGDRDLDLRVTGVVREFNDLGRMITVPGETLRRAKPDSGADGYVVRVRPGADPSTFGRTLSDETGGLLGFALLDENALPKPVRDMRSVASALGWVMVLVVAVGVLSTVSLAVAERRREMGILKAVGMTPAQVTTSVLAGMILLAVLGFVAGLPTGMALTRVIAGGIGRGIGLGPISPPMPPVSLALLLPAVIGLALAGALIPARSASRTNAVEALRYE